MCDGCLQGRFEEKKNENIRERIDCEPLAKATRY